MWNFFKALIHVSWKLLESELDSFLVLFHSTQMKIYIKWLLVPCRRRSARQQKPALRFHAPWALTLERQRKDIYIDWTWLQMNDLIKKRRDWLCDAESESCARAAKIRIRVHEQFPRNWVLDLSPAYSEHRRRRKPTIIQCCEEALCSKHLWSSTKDWGKQT